MPGKKYRFHMSSTAVCRRAALRKLSIISQMCDLLIN